MKIKTDVVIVGTGVAGMFSALKLPRFFPGAGWNLRAP